MKAQKDIEKEIEHLMIFCKNNEEARDRLNKIKDYILQQSKDFIEIIENMQNSEITYDWDTLESIKSSIIGSEEK